jgi:hypothetical protein
MCVFVRIQDFIVVIVPCFSCAWQLLFKYLLAEAVGLFIATPVLLFQL